MNIRKFVRKLDEMNPDWDVQFARMSITKGLTITVSYIGPPAPKWALTSGMKDAFYKGKGSVLLTSAMNLANTLKPKPRQVRIDVR